MTPETAHDRGDRQRYLGEITDSDISEPPTRVVHRNEDYDTYIGRGDGGSAHLNNTEIGETGWLGNPYKTWSQGGSCTRDQSIARYCADVFRRIVHDPAFARALAGLEGHRLACYCRYERESEPTCHGDILVDVIDGLHPTSCDDESGAMDGGGSR